MSDKKPAIDEIYLSALELPEQERGAFLDQICTGHPDLKERVQKLLKANEQVGSLLEAPAPELHSPGLEPNETAAIDFKPSANDKKSELQSQTEPGRVAQAQGDFIGPYKLLEEIGEGGMGTVWVAQQSKPIKRRVAIKLIKAGMDSKSVLARFEAERQALALMDHPNIARVLDGGMTEQGRPYFAMEYVKGVPLTKYCDQAKLSVKERLELFLPICNAVQHAHQKGIIHRDLKPTNILVCLFDGKPVPKVIDFGLAKAMYQSLTDQTLFTAHGMVIGTPLYMSPEQAEQNNLDIDTRTDIYSLGVILYELLTGSTPLEKIQFKQVAANEIMRLIKEVDPPKPSTRLSSSENLPSVAAQRSIEPARLARTVTGDLDWVVMKALEKERSRRYETANGLAEDLRRHLSDEPVSASPPSTRYRMQKFIKRNRGGVIAAGAISIALLLGVVGTTSGMFWAWSEKEQADLARLAEIDAKQDAINSAERAKQEQIRAEQNFDSAQQAVEEYLVNVTENEKLKEADFGKLRKELLQSAAPFYKRLIEQNPNDKKVEASRAEAIYRLANIQRITGELTDADANFQNAIGVYLRLVKDFPNNSDYQLSLSRCHLKLGLMMSNGGDFEGAKTHWEESRSICQSLADSDPHLAEARRDLATSIVALSTIHKESRDILGQESDEDELRLSRAMLQQAVTLQKQLVTEYPNDSKDRIKLANSYNNMANIAAKLGDLEEAVRNVEESLAIYAGSPDLMKISTNPVICRTNLVFYLTQMGELEEAVKHSQVSQSEAERLVRDFPSVFRHRIWLGIVFYRRGNIAAADDLESAVEWYDKSEEVLSSVLEQFPNNAEAITRLRNVLWNRANSLGTLGRYEDAARAWRKFADYQRKTNASSAAHGEANLADCLNSLANRYASERDHERAKVEYLKAIEIQKRISTDFPTVPKFRADLARSHYNLANILCGIGTSPGLADGKDAEKNYRIANSIQESLATESPDDPRLRTEIGSTKENLAILVSRSGRHEEAEKLLKATVEIHQKLVAEFPENEKYRDSLSFSNVSLGLVYLEQGKYHDAITSYRSALSIRPDYDRAHNSMGWTFLNMGRIEEAISAFRRGLELTPHNSQAQSTLAIAEAARDAKEILRKNVEPVNAERRILLGKYYAIPGKKLYLNAAQQYKAAFTADPELANPGERALRYDAACYALRAISGDGNDAQDLTPQQIEEWRQQALSWLSADLKVHHRNASSADVGIKNAAIKSLQWWLKDADLSVVREPSALEDLPKHERHQWESFWKQVSESLAL